MALYINKEISRAALNSESIDSSLTTYGAVQLQKLHQAQKQEKLDNSLGRGAIVSNLCLW